MFYYIPVLFCNILPIVYVVKRKITSKESIKKYFILLFYYLIFLPIFNFILGWSGVKSQSDYMITKLIAIANILFLLYSIYRIAKYVFLDIVRRKRKITYNDLGYVFLSYIGIGFTFGFVYYVLFLIFGEGTFYGLSKNPDEIIDYFYCIYFSFITLATVGYGDIYPILKLAKLVAILEVISGVVLINLILAIVIGSGLFNQRTD